MSVPPRFECEREVRFAVVMYGGVSLAIYINGVVQELFALVRATAPVRPHPDKPHGQRAWFRTDDLNGVERVYRELGQLLPEHDPAAAAGPDGEEPPIRTRFVIDILSGTSAGGINAIFLAKALANQQTIGGLKRLWIEEGDIGGLLNEDSSYKGLPKDAGPSKAPASLLNGRRLYDRALAAMRGMRGTEEAPGDDEKPSYAEQVDLAVTMTDLQGLRLPIELYDRVIYEPRHRNVLRFVYATEEATGEHRNDFTAEHDRLLAFAARATSSFPFAFEPVVPIDVTPWPDKRETELLPASWNPWFREYARRKAKYQEYAFADGGYLDNKPFSYATEALRRRRADVPVDRTLLYVEPDPSGDPLAFDHGPVLADPPRGERPGPFANVAGAASILPRVETIREDIAAVVDRNRSVEQLRRIERAVEDTILDSGGEGPTGDALEAYRRLRLEIVVDDLAGLVTRVAGFEEDSDERAAIRQLVAGWARPRDVGALLADFDLAFHLRRMNFLQDRISDLVRAEERGRAIATRAGVPEAGLDDSADGLRDLKLALNTVFVELRRKGRDARRPDGMPGLETEILAVGLKREHLASLLVQRTEAAVRARAGEVLTDGARARMDNAASLLKEAFAAAFAAADAAVAAALADPGPPGRRPVAPALLQALRTYRDRFERFDAVMLPLAHPDLGEVNPVRVMRIAPDDAPSLIDEGAQKPERRKLAGVRMGHFGGFLDADWRRSDLLWGRLDGAERIIAAVLPEHHPRRDELRLRAHAAILREELLETDAGRLTTLMLGAFVGGDKPVPRESGEEATRVAILAELKKLDDEAIVSHFRKAWRAPPQLETTTALNIMGRATSVTGELLGGVAGRSSAPGKAGFWLARAGRLLWGVAELAMPAGRPTGVAAVMSRWWAQIALLLGLLLVVFGVLGVEGASGVGWLLIAGTLVVVAAVWLAGAAAKDRNVALQVALVALVLALLALAAVEVLRHGGDDLDALGLGLVVARSR